MYYLTNQHLTANPTIRVVGCGGTGGFVAEGLLRLFTGRPATIILQDHDRIEPHNLLRQHFYPEEIGEFKSKALAERLSRQYRRPVGYSIYPFRAEDSVQPWGSGMYSSWSADHDGHLLIGCVDNALARAEMAAAVRPWMWYVDAGNGETWGQVLVGNSQGEAMRGCFEAECNVVTRLPLPTVQMPALLESQPDSRPDLDCAAALDLTGQDPTINQVMATWVLQVVRRLVAGTCPWMAIYIDLGQGTVRPVYATPEEVGKVVKKLRLARTEKDWCRACGQYHN
jgi:hypothetical protein